MLTLKLFRNSYYMRRQPRLKDDNRLSNYTSEDNQTEYKNVIKQPSFKTEIKVRMINILSKYLTTGDNKDENNK